MHRKKKISAVYILFFVIAIAVAVWLSFFVLPVPSDYKGFVLFGLITLISFVLVFVDGIIKKRKRRG